MRLWWVRVLRVVVVIALLLSLREEQKGGGSGGWVCSAACDERRAVLEGGRARTEGGRGFQERHPERKERGGRWGALPTGSRALARLSLSLSPFCGVQPPPSFGSRRSLRTLIFEKPDINNNE